MGSEVVVRGDRSAITAWQGERGETKQDIVLRGGNRISTRGGIFRMGEAESGRAIEVVVVDWCYANQYFPGDYDQNDTGPPECWAFGRTPAGMEPSDKADQRSKTCPTCSLLAWGSGKGRAKACKEGVLLAVLPATVVESPGFDPATAPVWTLKVPVTAVGAFLVHAKLLETMAVPESAVVVGINIVDGSSGGWTLEFEQVGVLAAENRDVVAVLEERDLTAQLMVDPEVQDEAPKAKPTRTRRPGAKAKAKSVRRRPGRPGA